MTAYSLSTRWISRLRRLQISAAGLRSISILYIGTMSGAGLAFLTQVLLARLLGVEQLGTFSAALALVTLVAPLAGFGIAAYWLNAFGREGWQALRWLPGSFRFLFYSTALVLAFLFLWAWAGPHDHSTAWLLSILALHVLGNAAVELAGARFQLEGRHACLAGWLLTPHLLRFFGVSALAWVIGVQALTAQHVAIVYSAVATLLVLAGAWFLGGMARGTLILDGHADASRTRASDVANHTSAAAIASAAWPFGLAGVFYLIYFQSDIILIRYLVGKEAAGIYNVAFVVMAAVYMFPSVLYQKFLLPRLHRWAYHDRDMLRRAFRAGNAVMLALGLIAMVLIWLLADPVLPWLFGEGYRSAVILLEILAIAAPFRFLASSAGAVLTTRDHMRLKVGLMGAVAGINVMLNLILIPRWGAAGAAAATVLSDFVLCTMYFFYSKNVTQESLPKRIIHESL